MNRFDLVKNVVAEKRKQQDQDYHMTKVEKRLEALHLAQQTEMAVDRRRTIKLPQNPDMGKFFACSVAAEILGKNVTYMENAARAAFLKGNKIIKNPRTMSDKMSGYIEENGGAYWISKIWVRSQIKS